MRISKKSLFWIIAAIVVVIALGAALGYFLSAKGVMPWDRTPEYSAVYLTTGDIYFGEFSRFPKPNVKNVLYLQRGVLDEENQEQIGLAAFRNVAWGPEDRIYISPEQIVWVARIRDDSPLIEGFDGL